MKILTLFLSIIISIVLHNIILPYISVFGVTANISLAILISVSYLYRNKNDRYFGLMLGLFQDIIFGSVVGVNALLYFIIGMVLEKVDRRIVRDNTVVALISMAIVTVAYNFMYYLIMYFLASKVSFLAYAKGVLIVEVIYNMVIMIPVYKIYSKIFKSPTISFVTD